MPDDTHPKSPLPYENNDGRPAKIHDPETRNRILALTRSGQTRERAARAAGISEAALYNWLQRGRREQHRRDEGLEPRPKETIYLDFSDAMERADAEGEAQLIAAVRDSVARGGTKKKTKREYAPDGTVVSETVEEEELPGKIDGAKFILQSRFGWTPRTGVDVTLDEEALAAKFAQIAEELLSGLDLEPDERAEARTRLAEMLRAADEGS